MKQHFYLILLLLSISACHQDTKQEAAKKSDELLEFIPENYSILDTISGDLNLDKINDYILILRKNNEDSLTNTVKPIDKRITLLLIRDQNNKLKIAKRNDNVVYYHDFGGAKSDPFSSVYINDGLFSITHFAGDSWVWTRHTVYQFSPEDNEWYLHTDKHDVVNTKTLQFLEQTIKTTKEFGIVKFEDFDIYKEL